MEDIRKMSKVMEILGGKKDKEVRVWDDVGFLENIFPKEKSSIEIIQELRKR